MNNYLFCCLFLCIIIGGCSKSDRSDITNPNENGTTNPGHTSGSATIVIIGSSTAAGVGATPFDSAWVNRLRLATLAISSPFTTLTLP